MDVTGDLDQDKTLSDALANVKNHAYFMKQKIDQGVAGLSGALLHAASMLQELRTGSLSPQNYYDLYISVTDELRWLENYLSDEHAKDPSLNLYELVQYCGNVVPRLYLLVTIGSVYIKADSMPVMQVLFDLVEMCKGVQHPTRGLFLRSYLSQAAKDILPDSGPLFSDSLRFIIQNFGEVNRLWVRMQHQGAVRDRSKREVERQNLRMLVGTNLVRLSQLEACNLDLYSREILPKVLELVIECRDRIAQEYLMDCVIQVFPDEFHLATLETFLGALSQLDKDVNVRNIIVTLMNRLSTFAKSSHSALPANIEMFPLFHANASKIMQEKTTMSLDDVLSLQVSLINFASKVYPDRLDYMDDVLAFSIEIVQKKRDQLDSKCAKHIVRLLTVPLETVSLNVFHLRNYSGVMEFLSFDMRRQAAWAIAKSVVDTNQLIGDIERIETLFRYIQPMCQDAPDTPALSPENRYDFEEEQYLVARMIHLLNHPDLDIQYQILMLERNYFGDGGVNRFQHTFPSLVFEAMNVAQKVAVLEMENNAANLSFNSKKVFKYIHQLCSLLTASHPKLALRLFVMSALAADRCQFEEIAYEFLSQAFRIYEEEIADSKDLFSAIALIIGAIQKTRSLDEENYATVAGQATQHSARLLLKSSKVFGVLQCSHLFWSTNKNLPPTRRDGATVIKCLQRALKVADSVMDQEEKSMLFCAILAEYLYYRSLAVSEISGDIIMQLLELVTQQMQEIDSSSSTVLFFQSLVKLAKGHSA